MNKLLLFFCNEENGVMKFTTKKLYAFIFVLFGLYDKITLMFFASSHWAVKMTQLKVEPSVISTLNMTLDGLIIGSLAVYGWSKVNEK